MEQAMTSFLETARTLDNPYLQTWRQNGGRIVGYYYAFIPEEIFLAAGILPFRLRASGAQGMERSDAYLSVINCTYARYHLDQVLRGAYDFLDGVAGFNACDHIRRAYDNWARLIDKDNRWFHFLCVPQKQGQAQTERYAQQLRQLIAAVEERFGVTITDEALRTAIREQNELRALQRQLYALRAGDTVKISGTEALAAIIAGFSLPKPVYRELLTQFLAEAQARPGTKPEARLMLLGGEVDSVELLEILEGQGACVVTDMLWYGNRSLSCDVSETGDPVYALADYHLNIRPQDPRTAGTSLERFAQIQCVGEAARVDGYVHVKQPQCDMYAFDQDDFGAWARAHDLPLLALDAEYVLGGVGQMKTRVQAFLEML